MVKALYVHCPKTAGTAIRHALQDGSPRISFGDYSTRTFDASQAAEVVSFSHATPRGLLTFGQVSRTDIEAWYVFATIRNPWARLVSGYSNGTQHPDPVVRALFDKWPAFPEFAEWVVSAKNIPPPDRGGMKKAQWTYPQVQWFYLDGTCIVDTFVRVEHIADDWNVVCARLGIGCAVGRHGVSRHQPYQTYYSKRLQQVVGDFYAEDVALGGYQFQ